MKAFGRLKPELFYARNWQDIAIDKFIENSDAYSRQYNEKRINLSLGSLSPIEYQARLEFTT
jgi:putative transposase